ncbi:hypothetical protein M413DRAFT_448589 [Hebeloma cylindrosporum]|uniref:Uncharacterized protein n=1 Tax=Hebeloma cylindrosporum TaxID=76867 RepID=A0A0C3BZ23_HEBCY|nr:hypothetical protein M413DRAFT_448589 [Hebeloma cylindrosporum h7]
MGTFAPVTSNSNEEGGVDDRAMENMLHAMFSGTRADTSTSGNLCFGESRERRDNVTLGLLTLFVRGHGGKSNV